MTVKVLFVCLGNICRSPMAEAIFQHMVEREGLSDQIEVDSAGTGSWHVGEGAHPGTRQVLARHGIDYHGIARQVRPADLADENSYIVAMDQSNVNSLSRAFGDHPRLFRLLDFARNIETRDVPDPYYTGNFEEVFHMVEAGCQGLLALVREDYKPGANR